MKKFKFRFEAVEKVRKIEMEKQVKAVSLAERGVLRIESQIADLEAKLQNELKRLESLVEESRLEEEMRELSIHFRENVKRVIRQKKHELLEAKQKLIRERRELIERQKKKKALEILRNKEEETYYDELSKMEAKALDESVAQYWVHRRRKADS